MAVNSRVLAFLVHALVLVVVLKVELSWGTTTDVYCLRTLKASLQDPLMYLNSSWKFDNTTEGFICKFTGIDCWHPNENKVLNIRLSDMGLKGQFPLGLENCSSLTGLDLSNNNFSGPLPSDIDKIVGYLTSLELSSNSFSGEIPAALANITYLNTLKLDSNRFTGSIPLQIGLLSRMKIFSVANNLLTGTVPHFPNASISQENYANNPGLCGEPLDSCFSKEQTNVEVIAGAGIGGIIFMAIVVSSFLFFYTRRAASLKKKMDDDPEGNKWARMIKGKKAIKVSMFEKSDSKMRLSDLMKSTNNFSSSNIIGTGRTETLYKAMLPDGSFLMVKRLQDNQLSEKEFASEMNIIGSVKHRNLDPPLGFCVAKQERLLVYKYIADGTLYDKLHPEKTDAPRMDWTQRLKIAIGAAKGLAWLHHNCNPRILHRNISSKCIMLDENFEPRFSDFGLARLMNPLDIHLSTFGNREFGDLGYVAPEYPRILVATPKGDIFSFGTVLLELITGEKPTHVSNAPESFKGNLAEWIHHLTTISLRHTAIDRSLIGKGVDNELNQFLSIACNCVTEIAKERPTAFEVYQLLRAIGERYHFSADDEIMLPPDPKDAALPDEFIVALETTSGGHSTG